MPERGKSIIDRLWPDPVANLELVANIFGGPSTAMFLGPMARTANRTALAVAKKLAAEGAPASEIRLRTGWELGKDGGWRFEVSDDGLKVNPGASRGVGPLSAVSHPALEAAYPQLRQMGVRVETVPGNSSYRAPFFGLRPKIDVRGIEPRKAAAHELQHAVQNIEGFEGGAHSRNGFDKYMRNAGEVEARNVETRLDMSPRERANQSAATTEDVPRGQQILSEPESIFDRYILPGSGAASGASGLWLLIDEMRKKGALQPVEHDPFFKPVEHDPFQ